MILYTKCEKTDYSLCFFYKVLWLLFIKQLFYDFYFESLKSWVFFFGKIQEIFNLGWKKLFGENLTG